MANGSPPSGTGASPEHKPTETLVIQIVVPVVTALIGITPFLLTHGLALGLGVLGFVIVVLAVAGILARPAGHGLRWAGMRKVPATAAWSLVLGAAVGLLVGWLAFGGGNKSASTTAQPPSTTAQPPRTTSSPPTPTPTAPKSPAIAITSPSGQISCKSGQPCLFDITGRAAGIEPALIPDLRIYAFVKPVNPPAGGWYLQDPVGTIQQDGTWTVTPAGIGNKTSPPRIGNTLTIQVLLVKETATYQGQSLSNVNHGKPLATPLDVQGIVAYSAEVKLKVE